MPNVFFTWVRRSDRRIHFEFLDNSVRLGELPRTVAFGSNDTFHVLDVAGLLNIERYGRVNIARLKPSIRSCRYGSTIPSSGEPPQPLPTERSRE
jgi:hypothetical protein